MSDIQKLEPKVLWNYFHEITQIPRPSKKEGRIVEFIREFGKSHKLETVVDSVGNVIIRKPATKGMENRKGVIFQVHLDMVPQKNNDKVHDFEKDPIETRIEGDWVKANGTTLGSDNGIGVAATLAVLAADNIQHGPVEALFTVDEETGMTGAFSLEKGLLKGDILMNLDSETEGEICVGCAGGIDVSAIKEYVEEKAPMEMLAYQVTVKGLKGGHSGVDIALGRANSNKLLFRFLMQAETDFGIRLAEAGGGDLRNAIPRESHAVLLIPETDADAFEEFVSDYEEMYRSEFAETEPDLIFRCEKAGLPERIMNKNEQYRIIRAIYACPDGVQRMSQAVEGLVETSTNMAIVRCSNGSMECQNLTRSSVDTAKEAAAWKVAAVFHLIGADVDVKGGYPGWKPDMNSQVLKTVKEVYRKMYGQDPDVKAIHAGLECAIIGGIYPNLDMVSFGPTIKYPHSPDEMVNVPSVKKFYDFMLEVLKNIPERKG